LEVRLLTGKALSAQQGLSGELRYPVRAWRVEWQREKLLQRIVERTDDMLRRGWVGEAEALIRRGLLTSPTARQALGYSLIAEHLAGKIDAFTLRERLIIATRQYARRQSTWFRRQHPEAEILAMPASAGCLSVAGR
jgi:tRNA dimethylallyltransferase